MASDAEPIEPPEPATSYPPRFRGLKRVVACAAVAAVLVTGLRAWWGHAASRRLADELEAMRARGEPTTPEELSASTSAPDLPNADNSAYHLQQAVAALNMTADPPSATNFTFPEAPPFPPRWHRLITRAVAANGPALAAARESRRHERVAWNLTFPGGGMLPTWFATLNQQRHLANLLGDAALHAHTAGDDAAAVEYLRDVLAQGRTIDHQPWLISHLVSIGITALGTVRAQVIATDLTIEGTRGEPAAAPAQGAAAPPSMSPTTTMSSPTTTPAIRPATRAQVRALIDELLDDAPQRAAITRSIRGEQVMVLDTIDRYLARETLVVRPLFDLEQVRAARALSAARDVVSGAENVPAAQAALPVPPDPRSITSAMSHITWAGTVRSLRRMTETDLRIRNERRLVAAALAVRIYRLDHGGAFPPSLDALVPAYLAAVPRDVMAADGRPIGYRPSLGGRPLVYSVGENGIDDTAAAEAAGGPAAAASLLPAVPLYGWQQGVADQWRDLTRVAPPPPPPWLAPSAGSESESGEAADDEGDEPADPGEGAERETSDEQP